MHFTASGAFAEPTAWPEAEPMEVAEDLGKADVTIPPPGWVGRLFSSKV